MKKAYFIDTENIGMTWLELKLEFKDEDDIFIFTSPNVSSNLEKYEIVCPAKIEYIETIGKGHNDMDILIGGVIGTLIERKVYDVIRIISNDTGYSSLVAYLNAKYNCDVKRLGVPGCPTRSDKIINKVKKIDIPEESKNYICKLIRKYGHRRYIKDHVYKNLCKKYGRIAGCELYMKIKKVL